jgi:hypothetical protein
MRKSKKSDYNADCTRTYSFRYDDLYEPRNGSLQLLRATVHTDMGILLTDVIVMLCAYEYVEDNPEYQKRFNELVGELVTKPKVQEWLLGAFIYKLQPCLIIERTSRGESDATVGPFAEELTQAVKSDKPGQLYREPIEKLFQELDSIADKNRPALLDEVTRRRQIAYDAIAMITPFRLSAMLIEILSNGFIAAVSRPAPPKLVEMVERAFLYSLKQWLLPTRRQGGSTSPYDFSQLNEFYATGKKMFSTAKKTLNTLQHISRQNRHDSLSKAYPEIEADLIDRTLDGKRCLSTISHLAAEWAGRRCGLPANRPETVYPPTYLLQIISGKKKK